MNSEEEFPIDEVFACLSESVDRIRALRERNGYGPEPGSQVFNERVFMQRADAHPFDSLCFFAYDLAAAQLAAAEDHIQAMGSLLLEAGATVAPFVLGRAAIEASGRAALLLDPGMSAKDRAALTFAERLNELRMLRRLMLAHDPRGESGKVTADLSKVDERIAAIRSYAREQGVELPERPSFTHVVRRVLSSGEEADPFGAIVMAVLSSVAHAVPDILVAHTVDPDDPRWEPFQVGFVELEDQVVMDLVIGVLRAYSRAVKLQIAAYGWPPSSWDRWIAHVRVVLRRALADLESRNQPDKGSAHYA
jgi:hypothetical protein